MAVSAPFSAAPARKAGAAPKGKRSVYWLQAQIENYLLEKLAALFKPMESVRRDDSGVKTIHDMRVTSRRLRVGLRFFETLFARSELKRVQRQLRRLTRSLGGIRTLDVHILLMRRSKQRLPASARAAQSSLLQMLVVERAAKLVEFRELMDILRTSKLEARIRELIVTRNCRLGARRLTRDADDQLNRLRRAVRRRYKQYRRRQTPRTFHQLRIAAKRYRYGLELAQAVFQIGASDRIKAVEDLQDCMGDCHDIEEILIFLKEAQDRIAKRDKTLAGALKKMIRFYEDELEKRFSSFETLLAEKRPWMKKVKL